MSLQYQQTHGYFAQTSDGLEKLAARELSALGVQAVRTTYRGVHFQTNHAGLYRVNYCARLITRVLAPLITFDCHSDRYLYRTARRIPWTELFSPSCTFAVSARTNHSVIRHSHYAALRLKDAVADAFRAVHGVRPNVDSRNPDIHLVLHIQNNRATISWNTSGDSLHRRCYRTQSVEAPMQETVAAAVLQMIEWDEKTPLVDPMCGSATLLAEALMRVGRIPASHLRKRFGFERLPDFDHTTWQAVRAEADDRIRPPEAGLISGSDRSGRAVHAARANLQTLPGGERIPLQTADLFTLGGLPRRIIVSNPPYGLRLGAEEDMGAFMGQLGDFLKKHCTGSSAFLYLGRPELSKHIGLRPAWKQPLKSGGLDGRLVRYDLYR